MPLVQPLYYYYPEIYDEPIYKNEYYFGTELFVAPITKPNEMVTNRAIEKIFLPVVYIYFALRLKNILIIRYCHHITIRPLPTYAF